MECFRRLAQLLLFVAYLLYTASHSKSGLTCCLCLMTSLRLSSCKLDTAKCTEYNPTATEQKRIKARAQRARLMAPQRKKKKKKVSGVSVGRTVEGKLVANCFQQYMITERKMKMKVHSKQTVAFKWSHKVQWEWRRKMGDWTSPLLADSWTITER